MLHIRRPREKSRLHPEGPDSCQKFREGNHEKTKITYNVAYLL